MLSVFVRTAKFFAQNLLFYLCEKTFVDKYLISFKQVSDVMQQNEYKKHAFYYSKTLKKKNVFLL